MISINENTIKNYDELHQKHPNCIILFSGQKNYFAIKDSAVKVVDSCPVEMVDFCSLLKVCFFPCSELDNYLPLMIRKGYRIAIQFIDTCTLANVG